MKRIFRFNSYQIKFIYLNNTEYDSVSKSDDSPIPRDCTKLKTQALPKKIAYVIIVGAVVWEVLW